MPRANFLTPETVDGADLNMPLPIGFGQTNSQPETVELMLEWLEVDEGQGILDVGSGSGWTTALLAHLIGPHGHVTAVEIIPELVEFGRQNCERLGVRNAEFQRAGTTLGWPPNAPYDRILVSAAASELPSALLAQLKPGGKLVIPVKDSILIIDKDEQSVISSVEKPGFVFVPLLQPGNG